MRIADMSELLSVQAARAAAALGVLQRRQRPGERQRMSWDFPAAWPDAARAAFAAALEGGAAWSAALAAAAAQGAASGSSGALAVPVALERARAVEAWGRVQMVQASPAGEVQVRSPNETRVYRWGLDMWKLPGGNPAGLEPRYLLARRTFGLSEAEARAFASGAGVSSAAAQAARPGTRVAAPALTRAPEASSRARPPRARAAAAPRRASEAGSPVVAVGAGAAVGALAGPALLGTGLGVSAAGGALAGYLLAGGASAATLGAPDTPPHEGDYWISTDDARDYARWLAGKVEALHAEAAAWMYEWSTLERANEWFRATDWQDWRSNWRTYHADLEGRWASRVGAWRDIKAWHGEYRAKRDHAAALGLLLSSASAAPLPDEVTDQLHRGAGEWWAEVTGGVARAGLGVLLLGAGALALVWASQDV